MNNFNENYFTVNRMTEILPRGLREKTQRFTVAAKTSMEKRRLFILKQTERTTCRACGPRVAKSRRIQSAAAAVLWEK